MYSEKSGICETTGNKIVEKTSPEMPWIRLDGILANAPAPYRKYSKKQYPKATSRVEKIPQRMQDGIFDTPRADALRYTTATTAAMINFTTKVIGT
jgi:hypothetical protein